MAILDIPSIGIHDMVVVEGTSPENLTLGPGHSARHPAARARPGCQRDLRPAATFGAPFAHLDDAAPGDDHRTITGQGESTYGVAAFGSSQPCAVEDRRRTGCCCSPPASPVVPSYYVEVDARPGLAARSPSPGGRPVINASELALASDGGALVLTLHLGAGPGPGLGRRAPWPRVRWSPWAAYLAPCRWC